MLALYEAAAIDHARGAMTESDHELTPQQWEALKVLRMPATKPRSVNRFALGGLIALGLAAIGDNSGLPEITPQGRSALVRGSPDLLDVAA